MIKLQDNKNTIDLKKEKEIKKNLKVNKNPKENKKEEIKNKKDINETKIQIEEEIEEDPKDFIDPFKYFNISNDLLPFDDEKRRYLFEVRDLYLTLSQFNEAQILKLKTFIASRTQISHILLAQNYLKNELPVCYKQEEKMGFNLPLNLKLNSLYLYTYEPYNLIIHKLANALMRNGKKGVILKEILKFFEILKLRLHISNPLASFISLLFQNLVPLIRTKVIGFRNKKTIGLSITITKRISITIKTFVKGVTSHKLPIVYSLMTEYFNLLKGVSYLQTYNTKLIKEIQEHKLYKNLDITGNPETSPTVLTLALNPEYFGLPQGNPAFSLNNILKIDWLNFEKIVQDLKIINLYEICKFQQQVIHELKRFILLKYYPEVNEEELFMNMVVSPSLIKKYNVNMLHKVFEYDFLTHTAFNSEAPQNTKKYIFKEGKPIRKTTINAKDYLNNYNRKAKLIYQHLMSRKEQTLVGETESIKVKYFYSKLLTFYLADKDNKFLTYQRNPDFPQLHINRKVVDYYLEKNINNFNYFPIFIHELNQRIPLKISDNLSEEDYVALFLGYNPNLINLKLDKKRFSEIPIINKLFDSVNIWTPIELEKDSNKNIYTLTENFLPNFDILKKPIKEAVNSSGNIITESLYQNPKISNSLFSQPL